MSRDLRRSDLPGGVLMVETCDRRKWAFNKKYVLTSENKKILCSELTPGPAHWGGLLV
jgi:hypothetical protein